MDCIVCTDDSSDGEASSYVVATGTLVGVETMEQKHNGVNLGKQPNFCHDLNGAYDRL